MYTSMLVLALSGFAPAADASAGVTWHSDYGAAKKQAASANKPLAVFLGAGADGWRKMSREGALPEEARQLLASQYVCVHIDTATEKGKRLAAEFEMPEGLGIVISDRTGELQAFYHEGDFANADLVRYLKRYGDPTYVVRATESNPGKHGRGGHHAAPVYSHSYAPSYCPSCSGCAGGRCRR